MTYLLAGLLIGVIAAGWFGYESQQNVYDKLIFELQRQVQEARNEAKVFRGLLFPSINKAEVNLGDVRSASPAQISGEGSSAASRTAPKGASARRRMRISTKDWFNQMRRASNGPQVKTDALAAAIEHVNAQQQVQQKVPSQEKSHA